MQIMKFFLLSLTLGVIGQLNSMGKKDCTRSVHNSPYAGKTTTIVCKEKNGCTSEKTIFKGGGSLTIQHCPPAKKK